MSSTRPIATNSGAERSALPAVWEDLCGALSRASQRVVGEGVPDSPRDRAEGFRYLTRLLAAGTVVCIEHADPDYPEFGRMIDRTMTTQHAVPGPLRAPESVLAVQGDLPVDLVIAAVKSHARPTRREGPYNP